MLHSQTTSNELIDSDYLELLAAKFVAIIARSVPDKLISSVFASPLSARSPDLCMLWHPVYRKNYRAKLFFVLLLSMFYSSLKGIIKLAINHKNFGYAIYGKVDNSILVVPSMCGTQASGGEYKTSYVDTVKGDALFVFGPYNSCGTNSARIKELLLAEKLTLIYSLAKSGLCASARLDCRMIDNIFLLLVWFSWALSFQWLNDYYLEKALSKTVKKYNIQKIGCIHEMHSYVRVVWRVAKKYKAKGYAIQHAAISPGKRWYFCYPEQIEIGLALPDVMYVYNENVINMLKVYYKDTRFFFGCSARYSHWKNVEKSEKKGKYYLFVGGLAGFDNYVLITTLGRLLKTSTELLPVRLRLHPFAKISYHAKCWIRKSLKKGVIEISDNASLRDDLENAAVVIGMSTTVLEEALLVGCPVIQLQHQNYREFIDIDGVEGVMKIDYRKLFAKDLEDASTLKVDHMEMRKRLGLHNEIIDYKRLFSR